MKDVRKFLVETRNSDGYWCFSTSQEVYDFMKKNNVTRFTWSKKDALGDVKVRVPAWAEGRADYIAAKTAACAKYGSN